ncbi:MAG: hypothetical protein QOC55_415 [Thermoleophilaceae bacterium]|nr:hypothetical protein [Thermoleophilaceae bacterium]
MGLSGLALLEADARFHAGQLAAYRVRRQGSVTTTDQRFRALKRTARLADGRVREARALAAQRTATAEAHAKHGSDEAKDRPRSPELARVDQFLDAGETVVCVAEGLFKSLRSQCSGLAVLTDRRLLCVDHGARLSATTEYPLADITSIRATASLESGAAKRGAIFLRCAGVGTAVLRVDPWERASEIVAYVERWQPATAPLDSIQPVHAALVRDKNPRPYVAPKHWTGAEPPTHTARLSAELNLASDCHAPGAARRTLRVLCEGSDSFAIADADLAVTEVVTNAVRHAGGDGVSIGFWRDGSTLDVVVADGGPGFTPSVGPPADGQVGGRGLFLVDELAESWGSSICTPSSVWMRFAMPGGGRETR